MTSHPDKGNGSDIIRLSVASWKPRITVNPESRTLLLIFDTTADVEAGEQGADLRLPLTVPGALSLASLLLEALRMIEPLEPS